MFYNRRLDDKVIVVLYPSNDEAKQHYAIAESMLLSGQIVISTASIDKLFGEVMVAASLIDKHVILTDENDVSGILAGGIMNDYEISSKEELLQKITSRSANGDGGGVRVDVDHIFPVKGIGTVALGIVTAGKVKVHDTLYCTSGKQVSVKSIQSQDTDIQEAGIGTRVGLALKGAEPDDMEKGDLLLSAQAAKARSTKASLKVSALAHENVAEQSRYIFVSNFTHVVVKVVKLGAAECELSFEKPISILKGDRFFLIRDQEPKIFASGTVLEAMA